MMDTFIPIGKIDGLDGEYALVMHVDDIAEKVTVKVIRYTDVFAFGKAESVANDVRLLQDYYSRDENTFFPSLKITDSRDNKK